MDELDPMQDFDISVMDEESVPEEIPDNEIYFANLPTDKIGDALMKKIEEHRRSWDAHGQFARMEKSYNCYYGQPFNSVTGVGSQLTAHGDKGEYADIRVNHYRNIGQHQVGLTTADLPVPRPIAANTDASTIGQVLAAKGVLEHYRRSLDLDKLIYNATEFCVMFGEGYIKTEWDSEGGDEKLTVQHPDTGQATPVRTGTPKAYALTPMDVIKDAYLTSQADTKWYITISWVNRHELIARNPVWRKEIMGLDANDQDRDNFRLVPGLEKSDIVPVYELMHERTPAVPEGKHVIFCDAKCIFSDGPLPYKKIPLRRIAPAELHGTHHGWTVMFELLGVQEALDQLYSIVLSNQRMFGHQNILIPEGSNISINQLSGGLNFIKYFPQMNGVKPEALNLTVTPKEIFEFIRQLEVVMETLSGVSGFTRGVVPQGLESGSSLAILQAQTLSFLRELQKSCTRLVQDVYGDILSMFKEKATMQQKITLVGKGKDHAIKFLQGSDINMIEAVYVEAVNPMSATVQGKKELATEMLTAGLLDAKGFLEFVSSGNLDVLTEADEKQRQLIRRENELIRDGVEPPPPLITDHNLAHIQEHGSDLANPELRVNQPAMAAGLAHITKHLMNLATPDPIMQNLLIAMGQQPLMLPPMPVEQASGGSPKKPKGKEPSAGGMPGQPQLPQNPATGETWDPQTGGGAVAPPEG